jgi:cytidyltransferase-like protein
VTLKKGPTMFWFIVCCLLVLAGLGFVIVAVVQYIVATAEKHASVPKADVPKADARNVNARNATTQPTTQSTAHPTMPHTPDSSADPSTDLTPSRTTLPTTLLATLLTPHPRNSLLAAPPAALYDRLVYLFPLVHRMLNESGVRYMIMYGTLLGWRRSGTIIPHDNDIDVCVLQSDMVKFEAYCTRDEQFNSVCHVIRSKRGDLIQVVFRDDGMGIGKHTRGMCDVYSFVVEDGYAYDPWNNWCYRESDMWPPIAAHMLGVSTYVPAQTDWFLRAFYGRNFLTPQVQFKRCSDLKMATRQIGEKTYQEVWHHSPEPHIYDPQATYTYAAVYTVGCFDYLHTGHIVLLEKMKRLGARVICGIHDDTSIEQLKHLTPSQHQPLSLRMAALRPYVTEIFVIPDTDPTPTLERLHLAPHSVYLRGDDMPDFPGRTFWEARDVACMFTHYTAGISSTQIRKQLGQQMGPRAG